jgi:hypothetical protein
MTPERFVRTGDIQAAVKGRETDLLDALNIRWREAKPHISCPYRDHADNNPSWRWDRRKFRAICTCGSHSILDVLMKVEGVSSFDEAKVRAAELLQRPDLIKEKQPKGGGAEIPLEQQRNGATPRGCRLADYAEAKRLPIDFLRAEGLREIRYLDAPAISIPYVAHDGSEPAVRFRIALDGPERFRWRKGSRARLYGLHRLPAVHKAGFAVLVEGESDCHTAWRHDFPALGLPGAGNWNEECDAPLLAALAVIFVVIEPDNGGEAVIKWLRNSSIASRARLVRLGAAKDLSALYLADPAGFRATFQHALDVAEPWQAVVEQKAAAQAKLAKEAADDLIREPEVLDRFAADLPSAGLVGEDRNAKILFLALTSRLFEWPVSVAVKGPSSGGKSHTVEVVLRFFPPSAYWERTMMSDRVLAYSDEDFRHRHLVVFEAAGMTSDIASYLIRSLLSEGRIRYELVEKTKDGMRPRIITKDGPTGLIVTTTAAKLHPENETRLLSLSVKDTTEQTRMIFHAIAGRQDGASTPGYGRWRALQDWLATGERRVVVPFAEQLADAIPPVAVRLRRDFRLLLTLVEANALLHRERRPKDEQGRIVAIVDDYAAVRELVADHFAEGAGATVKEETRETVAAVVAVKQKLEKNEVSVTEIAKALKLDKSAASRRVAAAVVQGFLVNSETRKGLPGRINLGDPLPDEIEILPHPDRLGDRCSVAPLSAGYDTPSPPAEQNDAA